MASPHYRCWAAAIAIGLCQAAVASDGMSALDVSVNGAKAGAWVFAERAGML